MANLTPDDTLKLARLARISLTDDEIKEFTAEIAKVINYVALLDTIDTTGLEPTSQVTGLTNVTRPDELWDYGYQPKDLLANVPVVKNGQIKVRKMIG